MITAEPSSLIKRVGFNTFRATGILDETQTPVNADSIVDLVTSLRKYTGIYEYNIFPNYQFSYFGSSGFVAEIDTGTLFTPDLYTCHLYRVIFCAEIYVGDETKFKESLISKKAIIRATIPDNPAVPMTHESTIESGWSPALGQYGGILSIGFMRESDTSGNTNRNRWFLYGKSGIHDSYVNALIDRDHKITLANMAPDDSLNEIKGTYTTKEEFSSDGLKSKAIHLAKENCRRLVYLFATALGIEATETKTRVVYNGDDDDPNYYDTPSVTFSSTRQLSLLPDALSIWPKDSTIYPFSMLRTQDSDRLNGYEIGAVLMAKYLESLNKNEVQQFAADLKKARLNFDPYPHSYERLDIETMYNTHALISGSRVRWYSHCSPIDNTTGVAIVMPIRVGLRVVNSPLFGDVDRTWTNQYGSAYPVAFPFKDGPKPQATQDIIIFDSHGDTPKQLEGNYYGVDQLTESSVLKAFNDESGRISNGVLIEPVFVYLSPHAEKNNTLSYYSSHS